MEAHQFLQLYVHPESSVESLKLVGQKASPWQVLPFDLPSSTLSSIFAPLMDLHHSCLPKPDLLVDEAVLG